MIVAILPQEHNEEAQHPYIPIQVKTLNKFKTALVNSGSCYNVISSKLFNTLTNVELTQITFKLKESLDTQGFFLEKHSSSLRSADILSAQITFM